jgi:hypothetical protein
VAQSFCALSRGVSALHEAIMHSHCCGIFTIDTRVLCPSCTPRQLTLTLQRSAKECLAPSWLGSIPNRLLHYLVLIVLPMHVQGVPLARRFALVPLGPPLLSYSSTAKVSRSLSLLSEGVGATKCVASGWEGGSDDDFASCDTFCVAVCPLCCRPPSSTTQPAKQWSS